MDRVFVVCARDLVVNGNKEVDAFLLRLVEKVKRKIEFVGFAERGSDIVAERFEECVSHSAADDYRVSLVEQVSDDPDLVGNLRTAENGDERSLRVGKRSAHDADLFFDQVAAYRGKIMGNALGGSVRSVRRSERVVDIDLSHRSELFRKLGIVLFLFLVETDVFDEENVALFESGRLRFRVFSDDILRKLDFFAEKFGKFRRNGSKRIFHVELALRSAQVRAKDNFRIVRDEVFDRGKRLDYSLRVRYNVAVKGYVEIASYEYFFAVNINVFYAFFVVVHTISPFYIYQYFFTH